MYRKLLISYMFKDYEIIKVNKKCFNNSPEIEEARFSTCFKIKNDQDLKFRIKELKRLNFKLSKEEDKIKGVV